MESVKKDKAGSEKALQDQLERAHADLASQKEFFTTALAEARASLAEAEARADSGARAELERKVREGAEREKALSESVEELRQGLTRAEQQASLREEMLRRDLEATERRCQEAETRHEELLARIPDSTRPLLRQIEAMQEAANMKVEVISGVEKALTGRLQEAQVKAAAAEERERATSERLSQTLSRLSVMETQVDFPSLGIHLYFFVYSWISKFSYGVILPLLSVGSSKGGTVTVDPISGKRACARLRIPTGASRQPGKGGN